MTKCYEELKLRDKALRAIGQASALCSGYGSGAVSNRGAENLKDPANQVTLTLKGTIIFSLFFLFLLFLMFIFYFLFYLINQFFIFINFLIFLFNFFSRRSIEDENTIEFC